jgi:hypothetical protein
MAFTGYIACGFHVDGGWLARGKKKAATFRGNYGDPLTSGFYLFGSLLCPSLYDVQFSQQPTGTSRNWCAPLFFF